MEDFIATWGLLAIFAGTSLEGETAALAGGLLAWRGVLVTWQVVLVAALGAFFADFSVFTIARRSGAHPRFQRILTYPKAQTVLARINRNATGVACVYRFIPGMRILVPVALAQSQMASVKFGAIAAVAALLWAFIYVVLGQTLSLAVLYVFNLPAQTHQVLMVLLAALLLILGAVLRLWRMRKIRLQSPLN